MTRFRYRIRFIALAALPVMLLASAAVAQDQRSSPNFLDNLFSRGEQVAPQRQEQRQGQRNQVAQADPGELSVRLDRMENTLRQLTGTIEQLQYRNQQLEMQLKRLQDDTEFRFQQSGSKGGAAPSAPTAPLAPAVNPGRRGDVFDPAQHPNAPGAPRTLGNQAVTAPPPQTMASDTPIGAPGGRAAGAPLDLNALAGNALGPPSAPVENAAPVPASQPAPQLASQSPQPVPPPRNPGASNAQTATLPPTASPQDEYDLAYGYVLHKDYALAERAFRDFLAKYPSERLVPDAHYWLGESLFQRQRYRDAAESFLAVSTKFEHAGKAPDSLLRLGQSLAALNQKEAACATLAEVGRKYPRASAKVKQTVAQEQKRDHC